MYCENGLDRFSFHSNNLLPQQSTPPPPPPVAYSSPPAPSQPDNPTPSSQPVTPVPQSQPVTPVPANLVPASPPQTPPQPPTPPPAPVTVNNNENDCLGLQNKARAEVGLNPFTWSASLQQSATDYAQKLYQNSPKNLFLKHSGIAGIGENLYANSGGGKCVDADNAWIGEKPLYIPGSNVGDGNFAAYGHYTQIVLRRATQVGCNADGSAGPYIVCHYDNIQFAGQPAY